MQKSSEVSFYIWPTSDRSNISLELNLCVESRRTQEPTYGMAVDLRMLLLLLTGSIENVS